MKLEKKLQKLLSSHCCTMELLKGVPQQHPDGQRWGGGGRRGKGLREKEVREKDRERLTDSNTKQLSPITCLKLLGSLQLLLFGGSTSEQNWTRGSWACQQQEGNNLYCCKEDADLKSLKSAKKGNGNVLNVGLTGSFPHLSITG